MDCEITDQETDQQETKLQKDSQPVNNPTICNENVKIQRNQEINAEK